jgi:hypothetical protein
VRWEDSWIGMAKITEESEDEGDGRGIFASSTMEWRVVDGWSGTRGMKWSVCWSADPLLVSLAFVGSIVVTWTDSWTSRDLMHRPETVSPKKTF